MLRIELHGEGAVVIDLPEEVTNSETLKVELESLKDELEMERVSNKALSQEGDELRAEVLILRERNKIAIGRCATKEYKITCLRSMHTSQRMEIETCVKQIKEAKTANRTLKADRDNLKQKCYVKYYPTDGQIKAEKERDELQMKLDTLDTWITSIREKT